MMFIAYAFTPWRVLLRAPWSCALLSLHWYCRNSEIYNHVELKERYLKGVRLVKDSKSDSAIIGHMYEVGWMSSRREGGSLRMLMQLVCLFREIYAVLFSGSLLALASLVAV